MTTPAERTRALEYTWDIINQVAMGQPVSQEILRYVIRHFPSPTAVSLMAQDAPQWLSDSFADLETKPPEMAMCSVCQQSVRKDRLTERLSNRRRIRRCPVCEAARQDKALFWDDDDLVIQFHPPRSEYVNNHPYVLHLWRKAGTNDFCERPPVELV